MRADGSGPPVAGTPVSQSEGLFSATETGLATGEAVLAPRSCRRWASLAGKVFLPIWNAHSGQAKKARSLGDEGEMVPVAPLARAGRVEARGCLG
jgi:hypothetical protein